jgi:hypothetical protein
MLVALVLVGVSGLVEFLIRPKNASRAQAAALATWTACVAAIAIFVIALFVGGGLRCMD